MDNDFTMDNDIISLLQAHTFYTVSWGGEFLFGGSTWNNSVNLIDRKSADEWFDNMVAEAESHGDIQWVELSEAKVDGFGAIQGTNGDPIREYELGEYGLDD